jgi:hypothetical protein
MVQYYRDMWGKRREILAPVTDLVGECGETKTTKKNKSKKKPWWWDLIHQQVFDNVNSFTSKSVPAGMKLIFFVGTLDEGMTEVLCLV